jgi:hypothetical protein
VKQEEEVKMYRSFSGSIEGGECGTTVRGTEG